MSENFDKIRWLLKGCRPDEIALAERLCSDPARTRTYRADQDVITEKDRGTEVYIILKGTVKVYVATRVQTKQGEKTKQIVLGLRGPGEIVGEMGQVDVKAKRSATVTTVEPCRILCLEQHIWKQLWNMSCVPQNVAAILAKRLVLCAAQIQALATLDVPGRVAMQLAAFAEGRDETAEGHIRIPLRLPQQEVGDMIGASRVHVNKAFKTFKEQGCINIDDEQYVTVLDLNCLEKNFL